ncbi:MAG TPA: adenosine deaminase [Vicinamibacteria bacterium]|nr:adenosine deaminase [Vicinamibacteria bacterium]
MSSRAEAVRSLPKVEIHLHLEGAIPLPALYELVCKYGGAGEVRGIEDLKKRFRYTDFPHFLSTWTWKNGFLREYEDFTFVASEVARDLAAQNIRYVEAFHSPGDFAMLHGLDVARITEATRKGLDSVKDRVEVRLIADLTRDFGPERGFTWLKELAADKPMKIVGIGLGGSEHAFPPEPYGDAYREARRLGLRTTAHAGEASGATSIWGAIRSLEVDRIGHGTRAAEDPALVRHLVEHQIPVEMCPISNLRTGVVDSLEHHPIRSYFDEGVLVSVNTDDPKMFQTSLQEEYEALARDLGFTLAEIGKLVSNAIDSTWADAQTKQRLRDELAASLARALPQGGSP